MRDSGVSRRRFMGAMVAVAACAALPSCTGLRAARDERTPGWLLRDVRLVDGSGAAARAIDVLVRGDRIERIGRLDASAARGLRVVEGASRVELTDSVYYREGTEEIGAFEHFRDWALGASADELRGRMIRPILPSDMPGDASRSLS